MARATRTSRTRKGGERGERNRPTAISFPPYVMGKREAGAYSLPPYSLSDEELSVVAADLSQTMARRQLCACVLAERREQQGLRQPSSVWAKEFGITSGGGVLHKARKLVANSPASTAEIYKTGHGIWAAWTKQADRGAELSLAEELSAGRPRNFNGQSNDARLRALRAERRKHGYSDLVRFQQDVAKMCVVLEDYNIFNDLDFESANVWTSAHVLDDLISLGEWYNRALAVIQSWFEDGDVRAKIAKLRETNGRTPEEAKTALFLADRLEQRLEARLGA